MRKASLIKITLVRKKSIISRINSFSNRFKRFINRDKAFNIILILLGLYFNLIRKRYKYFEIRIKRRLSFFIKVIFILFYYTILVIAE